MDMLDAFMYLTLAAVLFGFAVMVLAVYLSIKNGLKAVRPGERQVSEMGDRRIPPAKDHASPELDDEPYVRTGLFRRR